MHIITKTQDLIDFCASLETQGQSELSAIPSYITLDTEFIRDTTYWPRLCLIQVASAQEAAIIDPLSPELDLAPFKALLINPSILKVFHAARQDIEIFWHLWNIIPQPIFDTQIAAMVCGFGDAVSYETLVLSLAKYQLDKSARFSDWFRRPLTLKQLKYALADVTYLRPVYEKLIQQISVQGRESWLEGELTSLTSSATYQNNPSDAWKRLKFKGQKPRFLNVLQKVAAIRELEAQRLNIPRSRLLKDEVVVEVALQSPKDLEGLNRIRGLNISAESSFGALLLKAVQQGLETPEEACPSVSLDNSGHGASGSLIELLRVLLKIKCDKHGVAQRLVATRQDLEMIAAFKKEESLALQGWRYDIFGKDALALREGKLAISWSKNKLVLIKTETSSVA